jgi:hypothetical protein
MTELAYTDFRSFVEEAKKISDYRIIEGADWDAEIGALVESTCRVGAAATDADLRQSEGLSRRLPGLQFALRSLSPGRFSVGIANR